MHIMNCHDARQHWNLYHDSEGDAELHFRIGEHLSLCAECSEWYERQSGLERMLTAKVVECEVESGLWDQVLNGSGMKPPSAKYRSRRAYGVIAAAALVVITIAWVSIPRSVPNSADLSQVSAGWHERLQSGQQPIQFASNSDREVEAFLKGRVPFPVRCPPRKDAGFSVRGAGVSHIDGRPTAYLNGIVGDSAVSILVLPRESLSAFPIQQSNLRKHGVMHAPAGPYAMVLREFDQNAIVVVGRAEPAALERVINAYGSYPDHE
jgi:hypothetical protein